MPTENVKPCRPKTVLVRGYYVPTHRRSLPSKQRAHGGFNPCFNPYVFQRIIEQKMQCAVFRRTIAGLLGVC